MSVRFLLICSVGFILGATSQVAMADNLFRESSWAQMTTDRKASQVGDILSVIVAEATEARNSALNATSKSTELNADMNTSGISQFGRVNLGSNYSGRGEVRRSESLLTSISVSIVKVLPNGDYIISGEQRMHVNGEWTTVAVRGRIREQDISSQNQIASNRIANAEINYDGQGYVSRGARSGIFNWLFSLFGLV